MSDKPRFGLGDWVFYVKHEYARANCKTCNGTGSVEVLYPNDVKVNAYCLDCQGVGNFKIAEKTGDVTCRGVITGYLLNGGEDPLKRKHCFSTEEDAQAFIDEQRKDMKR